MDRMQSRFQYACARGSEWRTLAETNHGMENRTVCPRKQTGIADRQKLLRKNEKYRQQSIAGSFAPKPSSLQRNISGYEHHSAAKHSLFGYHLPRLCAGFLKYLPVHPTRRIHAIRIRTIWNIYGCR